MSDSVLFLSFYFPPENASGAARPYRFYKYLRRLGCDVHVLTASPQDGEDRQENVVCVPAHAGHRERTVLQFLASRVLGRFVADRSLMWAFNAEQVARRLVSRKSNWVLFSTSEPVISHVLGVYLKKQYGLPWIADFRDPLTGNPLRQSSGVRGLMDTLVERSSFSHADALIANTDATLQMWRQRYPQYEHKMHLMWNGFDPEDDFGPLPIPERRRRLLVHAGLLYRIRQPDVLFSSLCRLIRNRLVSPSEFCVRMIGPLGDDWVNDPFLAQELVRLGCLEYDGCLIPKGEARQAIATADSLILLDSNEPHEAVQMPAKLFDYVRVGRPVLAVTTPGSPAERLLSGSGVPHVSIYPKDSAKEIDGKLLHFLTLPTVPVTASEWFRENFQATTQARKLAELIASL